MGDATSKQQMESRGGRGVPVAHWVGSGIMSEDATEASSPGLGLQGQYRGSRLVLAGQRAGLTVWAAKRRGLTGHRLNAKGASVASATASG